MLIGHFSKCIPMLLILCLLVGCEPLDQGGPYTAQQAYPSQRTAPTKTVIGGLGGAAAGGLLAAALGGKGEAIAAGAILGGLVGGVVGDRLDAADRQRAQQATMQALESTPSGNRVAWNNPDSGHYGEVIPIRTYQTGRGQYCREYQQRITIGGQPHQSHGTACRQGDGSWQIVN